MTTERAGLRSDTWAIVWSVLRLAMAALILAAIVVQLIASTQTSLDLGRDVAVVWANFFSFFTILSNALSVIVLAWAGVWFFSRGRRATAAPRGLAVAVASVSTYMIITGIVYNLLLRGITLPQGSEPVPWSNEVLHLIGPLFLLLDLLLGPVPRALAWRAVGAIVAFPIVWVVYTLIRGPLVKDPGSDRPFWYPYPFLNPNNFDNGYATVALYIVGIAIAIIAVGCFSIWIGRRRGRALDA